MAYGLRFGVGGDALFYCLKNRSKTMTNEATRWQPGQSGNPNGRPKKDHTLTDALRRHIDPDEIAQILADMVADKDIAAIKYAYDRIDGKPTETVHNMMQNLPDVIEVELTEDTTDTGDGSAVESEHPVQSS